MRIKKTKTRQGCGLLWVLVWAVSCYGHTTPESGGHPASLTTQPSGVTDPCLAVLAINSPQEPMGREVRDKDWIFYFKEIIFCIKFFIFL